MWFEQKALACLQTVSNNGQIKSTGSTTQWQKNVLHHHHHHGHYQHITTNAPTTTTTIIIAIYTTCSSNIQPVQIMSRNG
jgi:uncharacterized protein YjlB